MIEGQKVFKVRETYIVKGWTYVYAASREEAEAKLNDGKGDFDLYSAESEEWKATDWSSLKEGP